MRINRLALPSLGATGSYLRRFGIDRYLLGGDSLPYRAPALPVGDVKEITEGYSNNSGI